MLDLDIDPKLAWALKHRDHFPVDVNTAPRELLLRVPGLVVKTVNRIVAARRHTRLRLGDVRRLTTGLKRAAPFLIAADHRPVHLTDRLDLRDRVAPRPVQLDLFG
jgi:predicted DNA-binding helix-hairpin-helix protein